MLLWLALPLLVYGAVAGAFWLFQGALLFPRSSVAPEDLPARGERLTIAAANGDELVGVHVPAAVPGPRQLLLIGFGGNAWNADAMAAYLAGLFPEAQILTFHYRGYGESSGRPSAAALTADAQAIFDEAVRRWPKADKVAVGFSIGSGVAAQLAAERPVSGLVLVTPFDSLRKVAAGHFPWLPVGALFQHELDSSAALKGTDAPVALIAAANDTIIPRVRTEALRAGLREVAFERTIAGAGHNDIYADPRFHKAMREGVAALLTPTPTAAGR